MNSIVNNQLVHYEVAGTGKVVVLLHGWGSSADSFKTLAEGLSKSHKVISLDFPGFGQSPAPSESWAVSDYVKFVAQFLEKLHIKDVHALVGHSFGGRVIIKGASTGLLVSERLVLIDAAGIKPKSTMKDSMVGSIAKAGRATLSIPGLGKVKTKATGIFRSKFGSTDYQFAGEMIEIFKKTISEDLTQYLAGISQPTLLIWGRQDEETPISDAEKMRELIKDSRLSAYENAGHFAYLDEPDSVLKDIREFLV